MAATLITDAFTHLGGTYTSTPDTPSPVFPDRLIRPLPKRPIRSRLSSEVAESILYPPAPPVTQLFYGAYASNGDPVNDAKVYVQRNSYGFDRSPEDDHIYEDGVESEEDAPVARRSLGLDRSVLPPPGTNEYARHMGTSSKASSNGLDGYDAFENTNNKKKRKIPTSGTLGCHPSLSADILSMSPTNPSGANSAVLEDTNVAGSYYGSGNPASPAGSGISGSGRARFGRNAARASIGRTPFNNASNNWLGNRPGGNRRDIPPNQEPTGSTKIPDQGIISTAIANAAAFPSLSPQGQENMSLLDQSIKPAPAKTQFTFTCESDSSKGMASWQTLNPYPLPQQHRTVPQPAGGPASGHRRFSTQGTQTSPNMTSQADQQSQAASQHPSQPAQPPPQGKKPRRSARSLYAFAARQRRIQQQYTNLHHPPSIEDIWICEFCEYESIFGRPPEALIRQYEIKDRKERKRLAEKRRLLEKAKMKGRKGKKATKNAAKNAAPSQTPYQQNYDRQAMPEQAVEGHGNPEEDYMGIMAGDEYDEPAPPPPHLPSSSVNQPLPGPAYGNFKSASSQSNSEQAGGGPGRAG
ncbi:hypothetical protein PRK78_001406 [Emydomyces testavorans]|uniref:Uncharacterized protein n=1 Tax=Emydomyces testavorans TaxID=2070801 RepID=A0AAF0DE13_9EURO|nr:hypothetical protein PRK78_001406 [Emydomyces testavorans]